MKNRSLLAFILSVVTLIPVCGQGFDLNALLSKSFEVANEKYSKGKFKGQILKGRRNGMGFVLNKSNTLLYAGDFYRNEFSGLGLLMDAAGVKGDERSVVYVGNWENGVKSGMGRCYDATGKYLYRGKFSEDMLIEKTDTVSTEDNHWSFVVSDIADGVTYMGEMKNGIANGYGIIIYSNGGLWQSSFKDGMWKGIGLYSAYDGAWETRQVKGNDYTAVTSSDDYKANDAIRKANSVFSWSDLATALDNFSKSMATVSSGGTVPNYSTYSTSSYNSGSSNAYSSPSGGSGNSLVSQYQQWERRAEANYKSLTNLGIRAKTNGKNTGGSAGQGMNSGNYVSMKQSLREAQRQMASIRQKASQQGISIAKSQYEDVTVSY